VNTGRKRKKEMAEREKKRHKEIRIEKMKRERKKM
jgi:hypothetical protein